MSGMEVNRRRFLQTTSLATAVAATGGLEAVRLLSSRPAWAAVRIISPSQAAVLTAMARHLFPHDQFDDSYYAAVAEALNEQAAEDPDLAAQLIAGIARLDRAMNMPFLELSPGNQLRAIESLEGSPFFDTVRTATLGALYANNTVARSFGFEGSSVEYGGYVDRGFNDLGWLPQLPDNG